MEGLTAAADGRQGLEVLFPDSEQRDKLLPVPLTSCSGTNPLDDDANWESAGRAELERLAELLRQRGQPLTVAEVGWPPSCAGRCTLPVLHVSQLITAAAPSTARSVSRERNAACNVHAGGHRCLAQAGSAAVTDCK